MSGPPVARQIFGAGASVTGCGLVGVPDVAGSLEENPTSVFRQKLATTVGEFATYITNNTGHIVNYGERFRAGERISTGFVESAVNQIVDKRFDKRQSMR